jgi:orotate phosphoribosyltransferase-like protein
MLYEKMRLKEQNLRLHNTGMKQVKIARELKIHQNYVWKVVNEKNGKN